MCIRDRCGTCGQQDERLGIRETGHGFQRKSGHTQIIHQLILTIRIIRLINRKAIRGSQLCKQIVNPRKLMAEGRNHLRIRELGKAEQSELFGAGKQCENRLLQPDIDIGFTVSLIDPCLLYTSGWEDGERGWEDDGDW